MRAQCNARVSEVETAMVGKQIAIIGGGPAGLMAAEVLSAAGHAVTVYDRMPSFGRKLLLAGKSGLNLTHAEDFEHFTRRFGVASERLRPALDAFPPEELRAWALALGTETFVGSSGRVFPMAMKASPLLRAWLSRLAAQGVAFRTRHAWIGFSASCVLFDTPEGRIKVEADATVLALGGASWPRLGSVGEWVPSLRQIGVPVTDFRPANCGFDVAWNAIFAERHAGAPVKSVIATSPAGRIPGEFVVTASGIEGSLVYAHAASLRDSLERGQVTELLLDLAPGRSERHLAVDLARQDGKASFSTRLRKGARIDGVKAALLREGLPDVGRFGPGQLAAAIKALPIPLLRPRPIAEAISSAGGVGWDGIDNGYMLLARPGVFVAGEMLDWEAPTGGYLLTACLATGRAAARGLGAWLG